VEPPEPVWMLPRREKSVAHTRIRIPDHPAHSLVIILTKFTAATEKNNNTTLINVNAATCGGTETGKGERATEVLAITLFCYDA